MFSLDNFSLFFTWIASSKYGGSPARSLVDSNKTLISCVLILLLLYCGFYLLLLLRAETRIVYDSMFVNGSGQNEQSL